MKFEKQTYTQTPNSLFLAMKDMDECELKVVMLICRYTFGYHREEVKLSTRRIADEIGMNTASVQKGADRAVERGLIEKVIDGNKTTLWRAMVSDSEIESPMIQKLNRGVSDNESLLGIKESNKEINKDDVIFQANRKMDALLDMASFPGAKAEARRNSILSYLGERLHVNTETKAWREFAKYADGQQQKGEKIETFIGWLIGQDGFQIQYWPPRRMMELWPQAFINNAVSSEPKGTGYYG
jgi:hypothetical protein